MDKDKFNENYIFSILSNLIRRDILKEIGEIIVKMKQLTISEHI